MKKYYILLILIIIVIGLYFILDKDNQIKKEVKDIDKFIIYNPFDLDQVATISKFRSCAGHVYMGLGVEGIEPPSSMKHYIQVKEQYQNGKMKLYAPFDGTIKDIYSEGIDYQLILVPDNNSDWEFRYFHVNKGNIKIGDKFKAGDLLCYASGIGTDVAIYGTNDKPVTDSFFYYLTDDIYQAYVNKGITLNNIIVSKEERLKEPCICADDKKECTFKWRENGDWVDLK